MLDTRTSALIRIAVLASRPEYRDELSLVLTETKQAGSAERSEVYEVFLQQYLFVGFPAALEGVKALSLAWPESETGAAARRAEDHSSYDDFVERGKELYTRVYAKNADVVREEMLKLSPELAAWALIEGYGKTLSRDGLDMRTRELCIVGVLTQLGWRRQLFSHIMGAMNVGASKEEIANAITIGSYRRSDLGELAMRLLEKA